MLVTRCVYSWVGLDTERGRTRRWVIWNAEEWKVQRDLGSSGRKRGRLKVRHAISQTVSGRLLPADLSGKRQGPFS